MKTLSFIFSILGLLDFSTSEAAELAYSCEATANVVHRVVTAPGSKPVAQTPVVCRAEEFVVKGHQGFGQGKAVPIPCENIMPESPGLTNLTISISEDPGNDRNYMLGLDTWDQNETGRLTRILHHSIMTGVGKAPNLFTLRNENEAKDGTLNEMVEVTCKRR
ncbi:MAG: hypothetical protein V1798_01270 [Pseudomonadota bacterium]